MKLKGMNQIKIIKGILLSLVLAFFLGGVMFPKEVNADAMYSGLIRVQVKYLPSDEYNQVSISISEHNSAIVLESYNKLDTNGQVEFDSLLEGTTYDITVSIDGYPKQEKEVVSSGRVEFYYGDSLSGKVLDDDNNPIVGASVGYAYSEGESFIDTTTTDQYGEYSFEAFSLDPTADYAVTVSADGYQDSDGYPYQRKFISGSDTDEQHIIDFQLEPVPVRTITGTIYGEDSDPIEGATVNCVLISDGTEELEPVITGNNGVYSFETSMTDSTYQITVTADGYQEQFKNVSTSSDVTTQNFTMEKEGTGSINVWLGSGIPSNRINEIVVICTSQSGAAKTVPLTYNGGTFGGWQIYNLKESAMYTVSVSLDGYTTQTKICEAKNNNPSYDFTIGIGVCCKVSDENGQPIQGATVTFTGETPGADLVAITDGTDSYTRGGELLSNDRIYTVTTTAVGYETDVRILDTSKITSEVEELDITLSPRTTRTITGTIYGEDNNPMEGATVNCVLISDGAEELEPVTTDNNGVYSFETSMTDSTYQITVTAEGYQEQFKNVSTSSDVTTQDFTMEKEGTGSIRVWMTGGIPSNRINEIVVICTSQSGAERTVPLITNGGTYGGWQIYKLEESEKYTVSVSLDGYTTRRKTCEAKTNPSSCYLDIGFYVCCKVSDENGQPIQGATVTFTGEIPGADFVIITDGTDSYRGAEETLSNDRMYTVTTTAVGYETDVMKLDSSTRNNEDTRLDITLSRTTRTISGTIYDENDDPMEGATVNCVLTSDSTEELETVTTDNSGKYSFETSMTDSTYTITVTAEGYQEQFKNVSTSSDVTTQDFTLQRETLTITGTIKNIINVRVSNATIYCVPIGDSSAATIETTTNSDGSYSVEGLEPGVAYTVTVEAETYTTQSEEIKSDSTTATLDFILEYEIFPYINGKILDQSGNPVCNATVTCGTETYISEVDGFYYFEELKKNETYIITVVASNYTTQSREIELAETSLEDQNIILVSELTMISFSGKVCDNVGNNISGAIVTCLDDELNTVATTTTDENGYAYTLTDDTLEKIVYIDASASGYDICREMFLLSDDKGNDFYLSESVVTYTVTFEENGGSPAPTDYQGESAVLSGSTIAEPTNMTKTGYTFGGWYSDSACTAGNEWDFAVDAIVDNITLYAKWAENIYNISGMVKGNDTKQGVSQATITLLSEDGVTLQTTTTGDDGSYTFYSVITGAYSITIVRTGYDDVTLFDLYVNGEVEISEVEIKRTLPSTGAIIVINGTFTNSGNVIVKENSAIHNKGTINNNGTITVRQNGAFRDDGIYEGNNPVIE